MPLRNSIGGVAKCVGDVAMCVNTVQNKACRYFLVLGKNASNIVSQGDMDWSSCVIKQKIEACRLYFKLENVTDQRLLKKVFHWSTSHGKSWERRFRSFIDNIGMQHL